MERRFWFAFMDYRLYENRLYPGEDYAGDPILISNKRSYCCVSIHCSKTFVLLFSSKIVFGIKIMLIGYARVLTVDQTPQMQTDALEHVGCERIFPKKYPILARNGPPQAHSELS